MKADELKITH